MTSNKKFGINAEPIDVNNENANEYRQALRRPTRSVL